MDERVPETPSRADGATATATAAGAATGIGRAGIAGFGSIVVVALVGTWQSHASRGPRSTTAVVVLALAYFAIAVRQLGPRRRGPWVYFVVQNALAGVIVWIGQWATVLTPLPIITHSAFCFRRRWVILIACLHAANWMVVATRCFGWGHAPKAIADFVAAEMFVVAFAGVVAGERRARADLGDANRKLAEYATQADELATAKERNRLAREIHDSLGHYLTIIHVQLQAAAIQIDRDPDEAKQLLAKAASLTHEGLEDVRRSVAALRASAIHDRPLAAAIADLAAELSTSGTATQFSVSGAPRPLSPAVELTLYRTAQEALTNVRKHAHAANAEVRLEYANGHVRLSVTDDGQSGPASPVLGFGLIGARERARLVGGHLEVGRTPGFTVTVTIPA